MEESKSVGFDEARCKGELSAILHFFNLGQVIAVSSWPASSTAQSQ